VHEAEKLSLQQIEAFLNASQSIRFRGETQKQIYPWIEQVLVRQQYGQQKRAARGLLRRYLAKMTGLSRAQVTRLIARYRERGTVQPRAYQRHRFPQRYTRADIELLATVDEAHENLSGPATQRILQREYRVYGKGQYQRLASISVSHLYNLRQQTHYRQRRLHYVRTRPTAVSIGERRPPDPQGQPGYLRLDTVHQGDPPGAHGVYHINAVDQVTQWQIVSATARISEAWLEPVLAALLRQFPFRIRGFHSDNGSEFINRTVARLLQKLLIEQTKSRAYHSGDNGLVESKNGAILRKHIGYGHIDAQHAEAMNQFHRQHLNPYLNFHRPCAVPTLLTGSNGKRRRVYLRWATPFELFQESPHYESSLRPGVTREALQRFARIQSDTEAALAMQLAKRELFHSFQRKSTASNPLTQRR